MSDTGIKSLVGKTMTKTATFMGEKLSIKKLSVAQILEIQEQSTPQKDDEGKSIIDEKAGFESLKMIVRFSVENAEDLSDEEFDGFPLDELSKLSNEIMKHSGIDDKKGK